MDLFWYSVEAWQQGFVDGGTIALDKKKQGFTFGTLLCGLELLGDACENGTHVFSIEQLSQRKTTRPNAQSIYQRRGGTLGTYSEVLAGHCCRYPAARSYCEV
jgi:hypothetical protein